jgi:hemerythrin-like metal-binding protein
MSLIWTDNLSVGIKQFDDDHKRLVRIVNQMSLVVQNADENGQIPAEELTIALHELENHFLGHCFREEQMMARTSYPGLEEQHQQHQEFITKVREMAHHYQGSTSARHGLELVQFIYCWLADHIAVSDKKYEEHMHSRGIR